MNRMSLVVPLSRYDAQAQAKIAIVLLAVIPALSLFYLGYMRYEHGVGLPFYVELMVLFFLLIIVACGCRILWRYPGNITKLRHYITVVAAGTLPERITLGQTECCDDLKFVEQGFNAILKGMGDHMMLIEEKLDTEAELRRELEKQQQTLLQAERHRVMVQSLGAACHHLGQPTTALRMRLFLLKERSRSLEEAKEIEAIIRDVDEIDSVLKKLRDVNEFRTEPYVEGEDPSDSHILAL